MTLRVTPAKRGSRCLAAKRIPRSRDDAAVAAALLLFAAPAAAQTFPPLTGRVVDQARSADAPSRWPT